MEATPRLRTGVRPDTSTLLALGLLAVALFMPLLLARLPLPVAAALCATGVAAAAALAWPLAGLLLFLGLIFVRPQDTFAELVPLRLALIVAGASLLGWGMRSLAARRFPALAGPTAWMLAFVGAALLSVLPLPATTLGERVNELARIAMILVLISQLVTSARRLELFCGFLVLWSTWLAVVAITGYYGGDALATTEGFRARGTGVFDDPNGTAIALVPAVPLAVLAVLESRRLLVRLAAGAAAAVMVWAIYLTNSRGGFLALAAALFVLAALRWGRRGLALGLLGCLAILAVGPSRLGATHDLDDSASDRIVAWQIGLDLFRSRPVTGVGMEQFTEYHELTAHNSFVLALAELGVVGTVCWVGLFVAVMRRSVRGRLISDRHRTSSLDEGVPPLRLGLANSASGVGPDASVGREVPCPPGQGDGNPPASDAVRDGSGPRGSGSSHPRRGGQGTSRPTEQPLPQRRGQGPLRPNPLKSSSPALPSRAALARLARPGRRDGNVRVRPGLRSLVARPARAHRPPADSWFQVNNAALAALVGILVGGMFLSDTYSEIPFIYLGLGAAVTGHLLARPGARTVLGGGLSRWLRSDVAVALALTLVGIAGLAVVVRIAG